MDTVRRLSQLVRIAQQYKVVSGTGDCENICERHLPGLIDDEVIQPRREASASEKPWRTGNDLDLVRGQCCFDSRRAVGALNISRRAPIALVGLLDGAD